MDAISEPIFRITFGLLWLFYFGLYLYFQREVKGVGQYLLVNEKQEKFFFRLFVLTYILLPLYFSPNTSTWQDFGELT